MGAYRCGVIEEIKKNLSEYVVHSPRHKPGTSTHKITASSVCHFVPYFKFKPRGTHSEHGALET